MLFCLRAVHVGPVTVWQKRVTKVRPDFESLIQCRDTLVDLPHKSQEPDPEDGGGAVVLPRVAPNLGDVSDCELGYVFRAIDAARLVEKGPCKTEMGLVAEVILGLDLIEHTETVAQIELGHPPEEARSRNSRKETWRASMKACVSGKAA